MAFNIRKADYFYLAVQDELGEAYKLLTQLEELGINMLAFTIVPMGIFQTQLTIFPEDPAKLTSMATRSQIKLTGPHHAILVQGDDELGALANIHMKLYKANVNVSASNGVTDGKGSFGYVVYLRPDDVDKAATALGI